MMWKLHASRYDLVRNEVSTNKYSVVELFCIKAKAFKKTHPGDTVYIVQHSCCVIQVCLHANMDTWVGTCAGSWLLLRSRNPDTSITLDAVAGRPHVSRRPRQGRAGLRQVSCKLSNIYNYSMRCVLIHAECIIDRHKPFERTDANNPNFCATQTTFRYTAVARSRKISQGC